MSELLNEVSRIELLKNNMINVIKNKGVSIPSTTKIDNIGTYINQIEAYDLNQALSYGISSYYSNGTLSEAYYSPTGNLSNIFYGLFPSKNLSNTIVGNNVKNMSRLFSQAGATGSPVCGPNVTDMSYTYERCSSLTGSPVCGNKVTDMCFTYDNCKSLTGSPVCGPNVTNMWATYANCRNLTGSPVCGNKVTNMYYTYENCQNLTGSPVCGPNVTDMSGAYYNCKNIYGNGYFYSNKVRYVTMTFYNKNTRRRLNLYVPSTGYNSTHNTLAICINTRSRLVTSSTVTWTKSGSYYYNATYNIYIYPVSNVAAARAANGD